jgi:protein-ribulosamine 3-kinase
MSLSNKLKKELEEKLDTNIKAIENLSGGCISNAYKLITTSGDSYFLKINEYSPPDMFEKEAHCLNELRKAGAVKVPVPKLFSRNYLVTEFINSGSRSKSFFREFGRQFAHLHKYTSSFFGFYEDNYIGSNVQKNIPEGREAADWKEFFSGKRLLFQMSLCEKNSLSTEELQKDFSKLWNKISDIIKGSEEDPSLLHGDLWNGNYMVDESGNPCIIDPAVYYGHREADLAMTRLFGGYPLEFYESYNEIFPLKDGWEYRENLYKLYHILNHLNLFGMSYYSQALSLIRYYL